MPSTNGRPDGGPLRSPDGCLEESDSPVFIVGAPRSGTTLTYSILLASGEFPVYRAESRVIECRSRYGPLKNRGNFRRFLDDFQDSRQFARSGLDPDSFRERAIESCASYTEFLDCFMGCVAASQEKSRWVEKTPNHVFYMEELAECFPGARFIHVIRDGRDVAMSQRALGFFDGWSTGPTPQLLWCANDWERMVREGRTAGMRLGRCYHEIRYEDLITRLGPTLEALGAFVGVSLDPAIIQSSEVGALGNGNTAFDESVEGISRRPLERWRTGLDEEERALLHEVLGETLKELGYDVPDSQRRSVWKRGVYHLMDITSHTALDFKHFLNRRTPVGRISRKPLELGLS